MSENITGHGLGKKAFLAAFRELRQGPLAYETELREVR